MLIIKLSNKKYNCLKNKNHTSLTNKNHIKKKDKNHPNYLLNQSAHHHHHCSSHYQAALKLVLAMVAQTAASVAWGQLEAWHYTQHVGLEVLVVRHKQPLNLLVYKLRDYCRLGGGRGISRSRTTSSSRRTRTSLFVHASKLTPDPLRVTTSLAPHNIVNLKLTHT